MNNILAITTYKQSKVQLRIFSMICFITLVVTLFVIFFSLSSLAGNNNEQALMDKKQHDEKTKVLIVISSDEHGYWLPEVLEPYHLLQQAGFIIYP